MWLSVTARPPASVLDVVLVVVVVATQIMRKPTETLFPSASKL